MARADTPTLLPLDTYAQIMAIEPERFNQVINPTHDASARQCDDVWLQETYTGGDSRPAGREDVAIAISTAEEMIAQTLGFWPAPKWIQSEQHRWPLPRRGCQTEAPPIFANWGAVLAGGREDNDTVIAAPAVVYTDTDGDGVPDAATIIVTAAQMTAAGASIDEVAVYYPDTYLDWACHEATEMWRIRPLKVCLDPTGATDNVWIRGRRCQFVVPELWQDSEQIDLSVGANFIPSVTVRRRYNNVDNQAQFVWKPGGGSLCTSIPTCGELCQEGCIIVDEERTGEVHVLPGAYTAGAWTYAAWANCELPSHVRLWYYAGWYRDIDGWMEGDWMQTALAEAIVRLANTYLPQVPCACGLTFEKWKRDREVMEINSVDAARCMSTFGTTARGALFAWGVVKRLQPLTRGGNL